MKVGVSAFYAWRRGASHRGTERQRECRQKVKKCFLDHGKRLGSRRISSETGIGRGRVRTAMKAERLEAIRPKRFVPKTTDSKHDSRISPNLLKDEANAPRRPGEAIVGDITYLPLKNGGWCYLAMFQDKFTRRIVGWSVSETMTARIVVDALEQARRRGLVGRGAIVHTDRGSQYASNEYRELLSGCGFRQSMSGKGNCYDNAQAESFFSRFKTELVNGGKFDSVEHARDEAMSYIEGYYNRKRPHSALGNRPPIQFEQRFKSNKRRIDNSACGIT